MPKIFNFTGGAPPTGDLSEDDLKKQIEEWYRGQTEGKNIPFAELLPAFKLQFPGADEKFLKEIASPGIAPYPKPEISEKRPDETWKPGVGEGTYAGAPWATTVEQEQAKQMQPLRGLGGIPPEIPVGLPPQQKLEKPTTEKPTIIVRSEDTYLTGIKDLASRLGTEVNFPHMDVMQMSPQERRIYRDSLRETYRNLLHLEQQRQSGKIPSGWSVAVTEPESPSGVPWEMLSALSPETRQQVGGGYEGVKSAEEISQMSPEMRREYFNQAKKRWKFGVDIIQGGDGFLEPSPYSYNLEYTSPRGWKSSDTYVETPEGNVYTTDEVITTSGVAERLAKEYSPEDVAEVETFAEENPEEFIRLLQEKGVTPNSLALVRAIGLELPQIDKIYPELREKRNKPVLPEWEGVAMRPMSPKEEQEFYNAEGERISVPSPTEKAVEGVGEALWQGIRRGVPPVGLLTAKNPYASGGALESMAIHPQNVSDAGAALVLAMMGFMGVPAAEVMPLANISPKWAVTMANLLGADTSMGIVPDYISQGLAELGKRLPWTQTAKVAKYVRDSVERGDSVEDMVRGLAKIGNVSGETITKALEGISDDIFKKSPMGQRLSVGQMAFENVPSEIRAASRLIAERMLSRGESPAQVVKTLSQQMPEDAASYLVDNVQSGWGKVEYFERRGQPRGATPLPETTTPRPGFSATDEIAQHISFDSPKETLRQRLTQGLRDFQYKMLDDLVAIRRFRDYAQKQGVEISFEKDPYVQARLLRGWQSRANVFLEKGTFGREFWGEVGGKPAPKFAGRGLQEILKPVSEGAVWRDFATYLTDTHAIELADKGIESGVPRSLVARSVSELDKVYPEFARIANDLYKYEDDLLNYALESGLVSKEATEKMRAKYGHYVPFNRVMEELQARGYFGKNMANIATPIRRIKGSERQIVNPLESLIKNTYLIINASERNQVGVMMANLVEKNPELIPLFRPIKTPTAKVATVTAKDLGLKDMPDEVVNEAINMFRPSMFTKGNEITVLVNGKPRFFEVSSDIREGLLALDREQMGAVMRVFSAPTRWLRAGATLSPDFMVRNPIRDQFTAFVYSKFGFIPGVDFIKGIASMIGKDDSYWLFRMSGAEHSMFVSMDREYLTKTLEQVLEGKPSVDYIKHPVEALRVISEAGEKGTRLGVFRRGLKRGVSPVEAGFEARDVTLDFAKMGTSAKVINQLIAFWNANIRGWDKLITSFKERPLQTSLLTFGGITMPSISLYLVNRNDPRWKELPQWQKDLFWIILPPESTGLPIVRIPKPFELGIIFGSVPERFLEWLDNKDSSILNETVGNLLQSGAPGFVPTFALPIMEWMTNYNFFKGQQLVPDSLKNMPPELQYTRYTSEVAKKMGDLLNQPPAKIDNLLYDWTAGLGRYALQGIDKILEGTGVASNIPEPSATWADYPVVRAFIARNPIGSAGASVDRFYDTLEKYEQDENRFQALMKAGDTKRAESFKAEHPELLLFYDYERGDFYSKTARTLRATGRLMTEIGRIENQIYDSPNIDSKEKRRIIDGLEKQKTEAADKSLRLLESWDFSNR